MPIVRTDIRKDRDVTINDPVENGFGTVADDTPGDYSQHIKYEIALFQNVGATNLYVLYGTGTVSTSNYHVKLTPGTQVDLNDIIGERISIVSDASSGLGVFTLAAPNHSHTDLPASPPNDINGQ
jgi:hypothetical protein|tara:strand:+ start:421 stop:795 length:375 start_codon:yes stop_codon:yes gene_type:complete